MTTLPTLRTIANDTPADATDVQFNYATLQTHINAELINRAGGTMIGDLTLNADPTADLEAATKSYVDGLWLPGMIMEWAGAAAPSGWVLCDGTAYSSTGPSYEDLFAEIAYTYGDAGGGNFNVPDKRGRVSVGLDSGDTDFDALAETGGSSDSDLHAHEHDIVHNHAAKTSAIDSSDFEYFHTNAYDAGNNGFEMNAVVLNGTAGANPNSHTHSVDLDALGATDSETVGSGAGASANLQPYLVTNFIIKL